MTEFLTIAEWLATAFGVLYVIGASLKKMWCWPFGIAGSLLFVLLAIKANYYQDALLNLYYIGMGIYGWHTWRRNSDLNSQNLSIITKGLNFHITYILVGLALSAASGYLFHQLGNDRPYMDALTTIFALLTTWLVARRILENWLYWVIIDLLAMYMYWVKGMEILSLLFAFYSIWSVFGFFNWCDSWQKQRNAHSSNRS